MNYPKMTKFVINSFSLFALAIAAGSVNPALAQTPTETPPPPGEPRNLTLPEVSSMTLNNGLNVVVVRRTGVPLVTASLLIRRGASAESLKKAGVASMTAQMLTKGTNGYTSTQIAQEIEFLGASLNTGAGWTSSSATVNVMKDKLPRALHLMSVLSCFERTRNIVKLRGCGVYVW
jgi:zinc protease